MNDKTKQKYLTKLFELSQMLTVEAFASTDQKTSAKLYDASHLVDMAAMKLKELEEEVKQSTDSMIRVYKDNDGNDYYLADGKKIDKDTFSDSIRLDSKLESTLKF